MRASECALGDVILFNLENDNVVPPPGGVAFRGTIYGWHPNFVYVGWTLEDEGDRPLVAGDRRRRSSAYAPAAQKYIADDDRFVWRFLLDRGAIVRPFHGSNPTPLKSSSSSTDEEEKRAMMRFFSAPRPGHCRCGAVAGQCSYHPFVR